MVIDVKKLTATATLPTKAHQTDACFDIYADCPYGTNETLFEGTGIIVIEPGKSAKIHTGFSTEIPEGYFAAVFCRSGMGINRHLRLSNSVGVIDSDYRGEWVVALHNDGDEPQVIHHRDRIAQFAILPVPNVVLCEVNNLSDTDRGSGGFGSTGK